MADPKSKPRGLTCGDSGGRTAKGTPCRARVPAEGVRCAIHTEGPDAGKSPNPEGRPRKDLSSQQLEKLEEMAAYGLTQAHMAVELGVSERTLRNRIAEGGPASVAYEKGRARATLKVAKKLYEMAIAGDKTCLIFWLKTQAGFSEKSHVELTGKNGGPVEVAETQLTDEQRAARVAALLETARQRKASE
jgi:hypothetical protein